MLFIQSLFAGAALVAAVAADVAITQGPDFSAGVEVGKSYTIEYTPADDTPTTIILRKGDGANLDTVGTLTESATSGSFQWTVDTALVNGDDYALEIQQGDDTNYWGPFPLSGSTVTATSSVASSTGSASATSSKSSSKATSIATTAAPSSTATHASASNSISFSGNSTISSATLSRSVTGTGSTATPTGTSTETSASGVPTEGAASAVGAKPMAFIFGAVAAMAYLN